jgi:hypothetical protein
MPFMILGALGKRYNGLRMEKTILKRKVNLLVCICFTLLTSFKVSGQIVLSDQPIPVKPAGFYIAAVTDERADITTIGQLIVPEAENKTAVQATDLPGGAAAAIRLFIRHNLPQNQSLRPVVIGIRSLRLEESPKTGHTIAGNIELKFSFSLQKDYGLEHLFNYQGGLKYTRDDNHVAAAEEHLRGILNSSLVYFNNWMKDNADGNRKLAKDVKISFTDYTEELEGDTIYYSAQRPLTWADFQSRNRPDSRYEAQVIPGIGYTQQAKMNKGTIEVNMVLKAYLPKSASRASYNARDAYSLNHEQRHFDIAKIVAEQFKQKVLTARLTPDTFEAFINMQYLDSYRDLDAMQKAYDKETGHGVNRYAQEEWNNRIDRELKRN